MPKTRFLWIGILMLFWLDTFAQHEGRSSMRVAFYNVENLFDTFNDTLTADDEFTPEGVRFWTYSRFIRKCQNIGKVLIALGEWDAPGIIGLCEVENRFVLTQLLRYSALGRLNYQIVHFDSPDSRGIDVGMLFRKDKFQLLHSEPIRIQFTGPDARTTRDVLYVKGIALKTDTLHLFVNHWPSKFGGVMATDPLRRFVAERLRSRVDSILHADPLAGILLIGDLNDEPSEASITEHLQARLDTANLAPNDLYNLMAPLYRQTGSGTNKFRENWSLIDQIIVSVPLLRSFRGLGIHTVGAKIFNADFLLEDDPVHTGKRLFRTYSGYTYTGGFADHLPVYVDILGRSVNP